MPEENKQGMSRARRIRRYRTRRRILQSTALLPAMFTLLNALAGFASMHFATRDGLGNARIENIELAAWLIFAAMVADMIDGRLARMTRRTSDFGAQLDSLADVVSFGAAPAMLMLRTTAMALRGNMERIEYLAAPITVERAIGAIAGIYLACATLRLARFNVESEPDEASHMDFRGLPSPGAAAVVAAVVLLLGSLTHQERGWQSSSVLMAAVAIVLPVLTLAAALLMVSRLRYPHVVNQYIRGKRSFGYLVKLLLIVLSTFLLFYETVAVVAIAFALSGPLHWVKLKLSHRRRPEHEQISPT